jgi:hypothetical protein
MKYLVMVQGSQADYDAMSGKPSKHSPAWSEKDMQAMFDYMGRINDDLAETGELVDGQGLTAPKHTRLVTADRDGRPVVTDGPYGETKELMAGYWVLECKDLDRVTQIAARVAQCPVPEGAPDYPVVIRQIQDSATDMT